MGFPGLRRILEEMVLAVQELTELVPDAFNMKSARAVIVLGEKRVTVLR